MNHGAPFTAREDAYLVSHYQDIETAAMAQHLGRTVSSTQNRLRHLGLRKRATDKPLQTKTSIFFDDDLMAHIRERAKKNGLSMSAYVQELVRSSLQQFKR